MATRKRISKAEKEEIAANGICYVCSDLGLEHAGFSGYELRDIHFDHFQTPFGAVGAKEGEAGSETLPIHGVPGGSTPDDAGYEESTARNCHKLRGDDYRSRAGYVQVMGARLQARDASFIDDVFENASRDPISNKYLLSVKWSEKGAEVIGKTYLVISEERPGQLWRRFLTTLPASALFTDHTSQVRPATKKTLHKMLHTYLVDGFPTFAPINARVDACGHVVIFDGNHRATSHALAFGIDKPMPVMIWDIGSGDGCALRPVKSN
jgi:hypothetical protein